MDPDRFLRAKEIFAEARARPLSQRALYLDGACSGDPEMRAEVEALLSSDQQAAAGPLANALSEEGSREVPPTPGAMIAGRYRIVALLGRGGMGEVYLAEDLTLGQQVALKFLSGHIEAREGGLERFFDEVRNARRVGHPNVARMHDVGETDGRRFLTMEYIDGEDLSHLLKRIGRLPREKAEEIARQLCAGLDAIHSAGILHRDLKPANVMLDGEGKVRITDFGLAASTRDTEGSDEVVGTPAYMAPEQLDGQPATERSEVFALGLLLYELFTGKRAFRGHTYLELKAEYAEQTPSSPSSVIPDLDPTVEETILACLRKDPQERPPSARAVAISLPGGDPLAAAIAAGKTPAPDVVADAPETSGMSPRVALLCLIGCFLFAALTVIVGQWSHHSMPPHAPDVLVHKARDFLASIGQDVARNDSIHSFEAAFDDIQRVADASGDGRGCDPRARDRMFWYRQSPVELYLWRQFWVEPRFYDPPHDRPGMVRMRMTTRGDLRSFSVIPPARRTEATRGAPDWTPFFAAAGLANLHREAVEPRWWHDTPSDAAFAWELEASEATLPVRVEAASAGGKPAAFLVMRADREPSRPREREIPSAIRTVLFLVSLLALAGAVALAVRNVQSGRGDRKGAVRIALCVFGAQLLTWLSLANHSSIIVLEASSLRYRLATAVYYSAQAAILYLAIEPYFRRLWPRQLISWVRLLDGRFRDRLVGRDLLLGALLGSFLAAIVVAYAALRSHLDPSFEMPRRLSSTDTTGLARILMTFSDPSYELGQHLTRLQKAFERSLLSTGLLAVAHLLLRSKVAAVCVLSAFVFIWFRIALGSGWLGYGASALFTVLAVAFLLRVGILGYIAVGFVSDTLGQAMVKLDLDTWYSGRAAVTLLLGLLVGIWGFRVATAGRPLFRDDLGRA